MHRLLIIISDDTPQLLDEEQFDFDLPNWALASDKLVSSVIKYHLASVKKSEVIYFDSF